MKLLTPCCGRLLGNSIQPYLKQRPYDIVSFTTNQLILAQSEEGNGDSAAKLDSVFALYFPEVEPLPYADVLDVLAQNSTSTLSKIRRCELGPAQGHQYDPHESENIETITKFSAALERLGRALVKTTTLCIPGDTLHYLAIELLTEQAPLSFFPELTILGVGAGNNGLTKYTEESAGMWWNGVEEALMRRVRAGKQVNSVVLEGKWCTREPWTHAWTRRVMQCHKLGLTKKAIDVRTLVGACHYCQLDLLGILSWL
ncbi:hypothetical protein PENSPDRAFT_694919 [Peniophora sp. CONT]|nr:hypothetical protein PENSPDRAFT_694919 [Peniophora sp. CONT]